MKILKFNCYFKKKERKKKNGVTIILLVSSTVKAKFSEFSFIIEAKLRKVM